MADFTTTRLAAAIDAEATRVNALTAMAPEIARVPLAFERDADALGAAYATSGAASPAEFRLAWIRNTLEVEELLVSEALAGEASAHPSLRVLEGPFPFPLDASGGLAPGWKQGRTSPCPLSAEPRTTLTPGGCRLRIVRIAITMFA